MLLKPVLTFFAILLISFASFATPACIAFFTSSINGQGDTVCVGVPVTFTNQSDVGGETITFKQWNFGDATPTVNTVDATHTYTQSGTFVVTYTLATQSCTGITFKDTVYVIDTPLMLTFGDDATCFGDCNGQATIDIQIAPPVTYHFMWDDPAMQTTAIATNLCAGVYSATISDDYGCSVVASGITVGEPPQLMVDAGPDVFICLGDNPHQFTPTVSGGTGNPSSFNYFWEPGVINGLNDPTLKNPTLTPNNNSFTSFFLTVTDNSGCMAVDVVDVMMTPATIAGHIINGTSGGPVTEGWVYLIKVGNPDEEWMAIDSAAIQSDGSYTIDSVPLVDVILVARQNLAPYTILPTYYAQPNDTLAWQGAFHISPNCGDSWFDKDIVCATLQPMTGSCDFHGNVILHKYWKTESTDPIPLIDVVVKKTPPGNGVAYTQTDNDGNFSFFNMEPTGPDTVYSFLVSIPGLEMIENYEISVDANDQVYNNLNFVVAIDTTTGIGGIYVTDPSGVISVQTEMKELFAFPNPADNSCELRFPNSLNSIFSFQLFDIAGNLVSRADEQTGNYYLMETKTLEQGIYIAEIITPGEVYRTRIMKK